MREHDTPRGRARQTGGVGLRRFAVEPDGTPYDFATEDGLCAVPKRYERHGRRTFVIDELGRVYAADNGGKPVRTFPDVDNDPAREIVE